MDICGEFVSWWNSEYEGNCELPLNHEGDHYDGISWFREEDGEMICTDDEHNKEE